MRSAPPINLYNVHLMGLYAAELGLQALIERLQAKRSPPKGRIHSSARASAHPSRG